MANPDLGLPPKLLLLLFCALNILIYGDRGAIGSNGINADGLQKEFSLSLFQDGMLPAAFMVGLLLSSPVFAEAAKHSGAFRLIGVGLSVWAAATLGCGLSINFITLVLSRMAVGVGEASFVALAATFIDDYAPEESKARWLATFYLCIPVGYALGFIYGGFVTTVFSWRVAFFLESVAMVPFIAFFFRAPNVDLRGTRRIEQHPQSQERILIGGGGGVEAQEGGAQRGGVQGGLWRQQGAIVALFKEAAADVSRLAQSRVYLYVVAGMTFYTAVIGAYAFYGPQAGDATFVIAPGVADYSIGVVTVTSGVLGTLAGGVLLDRTGSTIRNGLIICSAALALGAILMIAAFAFAPSFVSFCFLFGCGQAALFSTAAPSNAVAMWSVPQELRPLAMSMSVVAMHVLGDVPSPPIMGLVQEATQNWRITMSLAAVLLVAGAGAYGLGVAASGGAIDYRIISIHGSVDGRSSSRLTSIEEDSEDVELLDGRQSEQSGYL